MNSSDLIDQLFEDLPDELRRRLEQDLNRAIENGPGSQYNPDNDVGLYESEYPDLPVMIQTLEITENERHDKMPVNGWYDPSKPLFLTAVHHWAYDSCGCGRTHPVIVAFYQNRNDAEISHEEWVKKMTLDLKHHDQLPDELVELENDKTVKTKHRKFSPEQAPFVKRHNLPINQWPPENLDDYTMTKMSI